MNCTALHETAIKESTSALLPFIPNVMSHHVCLFINKLGVPLTTMSAELQNQSAE
jgi:hypothetical protein